jgi:hypothetical protein
MQTAAQATTCNVFSADNVPEIYRHMQREAGKIGATLPELNDEMRETILTLANGFSFLVQDAPFRNLLNRALLQVYTAIIAGIMYDKGSEPPQYADVDIIAALRKSTDLSGIDEAQLSVDLLAAMSGGDIMPVIDKYPECVINELRGYYLTAGDNAPLCDVLNSVIANIDTFKL